jgi:cytoskeletal protein CcmA (bactofilin family)
MGWFASKKAPPRSGVPLVGEGSRITETVIASGSRFVGEVHGTTRVRIEGRLEGSVLGSLQVTVAESGEVLGSIVAESVVIAGKVEGKVRAAKRFELLKSGVLLGEATAPAVMIAEGSVLQGDLHTSGEVEPSRVNASSPPSSASASPARSRL